LFLIKSIVLLLEEDVPFIFQMQKRKREEGSRKQLLLQALQNHLLRDLSFLVLKYAWCSPLDFREEDQPLDFLELTGGRQISHHNEDGKFIQIGDVLTSPQTQELFVFDNGNLDIQVFHVPTGRFLRRFDLPRDDLTLSEDGETLFCIWKRSAIACSAQAMSASTGKRLWTLDGHDALWSAAFKAVVEFQHMCVLEDTMFLSRIDTCDCCRNQLQLIELKLVPGERPKYVSAQKWDIVPQGLSFRHARLVCNNNPAHQEIFVSVRRSGLQSDGYWIQDVKTREAWRGQEYASGSSKFVVNGSQIIALGTSSELLVVDRGDTQPAKPNVFICTNRCFTAMTLYQPYSCSDTPKLFLAEYKSSRVLVLE
jgi:hypothetical protein